MFGPKSMTRNQLHRLLLDSDQRGAEVCLTELGDALVTRTFVSSDAFWSAPQSAQMLYALCSILHHAGHNGFGVVWDYHHGDGTAMVAAAIEALERIGAASLHSAAHTYWTILTAPSKAEGLHVPDTFFDGTREDFDRLHAHILQQHPSVFETRYAELERHADAFVSCWNSGFPRLSLEWLRSQEHALETALCEDVEAEPSAAPNGGPAARLDDSGVTEGPPSVS